MYGSVPIARGQARWHRAISTPAIAAREPPAAALARDVMNVSNSSAFAAGFLITRA
jgi:hypothetical protein